MNAVRHIVFDLGQVVIGWDPELPFRALIPDTAARHAFLTEVCSGEWNREQDRGRPWSAGEAELIARHPDKADLIRAYRARWEEMLPGAIEESVAVVNDLIDRGHDVTALTNWAPDTFLIAEKRYPFLARFRGITVSGRVGLVKPDPAIFHLHARTFGLDPQATLYFDDSLPNVQAARDVGWQAEHYVSPDRLKADLKRHGVA